MHGKYFYSTEALIYLLKMIYNIYTSFMNKNVLIKIDLKNCNVYGYRILQKSSITQVW